MKKLMVALLGMAAAGCCCLFNCEGPDATAVSPDGRNEIRLWASPLAYEVARDGVVVVAKTPIGLKLDGRCLCEDARLTDVSKRKVEGCVATPVYRKAKVCLCGNETYAKFGDWGVRLAARNDGVAYRFETAKGGTVRVTSEKASVTIPCPKAEALVYKTRTLGCEETVPSNIPAGEIKTEKNESVYLPLVYTVGGKTVAVTDSDVRNYPWWYLKRGETADGVRLDACFAKWPLETKNSDWSVKNADPNVRLRKLHVVKEADYLVETEGTRTYPWRAFVLADSPSKLCESDLVYALAAEKCPTADYSWVKPGKVAWDWWNCFDNQGDHGCNTKTYERFIDFAAKNGVEYVIFDEGWSEKLNIWKFHPDVDVEHLIKYANARGVGIILWMAWAQVYGDEDRVASHFAKLGAKGFKVDFMDRADADIPMFLERFAKACTREHMLIDYHGVARPTGLNRKYPNILNYEGIHGLEQMKFYKDQDMMMNDVAAFYGRLTAGQMDYTPGAMDNYAVGKYPKPQGKNWMQSSIWVNPGSLGTRCHQMAMMAVYDAPLQMLSDSPTKYEKNMECFKFMAATPVTWDAVVGLGGCPKSFVAVARKKGDSWYAASLNNTEARDFTLDTSFLGEGAWKMEIFRDAPNADVEATKYVHETGKAVKSGEKIAIHMAPGGGFVARFTK